MALEHLRAEGAAVTPEDLARLSPLGHGHINLLGHYHFGLAEAVARGTPRPLRSPAEIAADEASPLEFIRNLVG